MPSTAEKLSSDIVELWRRVGSGHREGHSYLALLGLRRYDPLHVVAEIRRGFSYAALERFQRNTDLPHDVLARVIGTPSRTLARRKAAGRLGADESDRLARAARVFARAIELFEGNVEAARDWLTSPVRALGGRSGVELMGTDAGAIEVEHLIGRLEHGLPA